MQKFLTKLLAVTALLLCLPALAQSSHRAATQQAKAQQAVAKSSQSAKADYIPGVVRVKMQKSVARNLGAAPRRAAKGKTVATGLEALDGSLKAIKGVELRPVFPCPPGREAEHERFGLDQWYEVVFDSTVSPLEARRVLSEAAGVESAHARRPMKYFGTTDYTPANPPALAARSVTSLPFNDPRLSAQWHYYNDGSMNGSVKGMDINLFEAWKVTTGSEKVLVAVIDGGIDLTHEDLVDNLWTNPGEIPGNGIDDDGNGYIDDIHGFNFCTNNGDVAAHSHGTHVAGTIAATNNNGIGVAGVAGGNGNAGSAVKLMSVQVFDTRSGTGDADFARAIVYAADNGATIANCSWGWDDDGYYEEDVLAAVDYFTLSAHSNNMHGGLLIFAAGNTGETGMFYPQCVDNVLTVGAMGFDGRVTSYSSYGPWVDVTAPGGLQDFNTYEGILSTTPGNSYGFMQGTSMAAPHVTGIAALVLSKYGSPTLTNGALRTQLETSVHDLYLLNPELEGLYGSGYIDAAKALQWGDGSAPETPSDISLMPAQDNITVRWTIPASSTGSVNNHIIYYSTSPFTAESDLTALKSIVVDTKYHNSGDEFSYELSGLEPLTTYYVAIKAVDRWGNASPLSEVLNAATNRGPKMTVDVNGRINLSSTAANRIPRTSFGITNVDEGLLKWSAYTRNGSHSISYYSVPAPMQTVNFTGRVGIQPCSENSVVQVTDFTTEQYPQTIDNSTSLRGFIGETDPSLPNSMAQLFTVDAKEFPQGFNLTAVNIQGTHGQNAVIEIYRGPGMISEQTFLTRVTPDYFMYYSNTTLDEQIYFEPGESFYVVVHFPLPQEELYPLGLGYTNSVQAASGAYMSTDMGQTWVLLRQALKGSAYESDTDNYCWAITAVSQNPDFSSMLTLEPEQGQVPAGETRTVDIVADASKLINGSYSAFLRFNTNESEKNDLCLPIRVDVSGQKPDIVFNKVVDFGSLIIGQSKTITVELFNRGYGRFCNQYGQLSSRDVVYTNDQFSGKTFFENGFPARSTTAFDITYTPTRAGSQSGQIIFTADDGTTLKLNLQGTATEAAKIEITPADGLDAGDLQVGGESKTLGFSIANTGKYPLQWLMPKYTDERIDGVTLESSHRFGYTWESNLYNPAEMAYSPMPRLNSPVNVTAEFSDYDYWTGAIDLGFDFPYYGRTYDRVYITSWGGVAFAPYLDGLIYGPLDENRDYYLKDTGLISAFGSTQLMMGPESCVEYGKVDGRFIVNFRNVLATIYDQDYTPISFHIVLDPSGDVEMYYDSIDPSKLFNECRGIFVALNDPACEDPIVVTSVRMANREYADPSTYTEIGWRYSKFVTGAAVRFVAPKADFITSVAPVYGVIAPGDKVDVTAVVKATDEMNAGATFNNIVIASNDPESPTTSVRINAMITGDLAPELTVTPAAIDFGEVFRTGYARRSATVKNSGRAPMKLLSATLASNAFTIDFTEPIEIPAGQSKDINVVIPTTAEGTVTDRLTIVTDAGEATVEITGTVIGCPAISLGYETLDETVDYGETKRVPLNIANTGNAPMAYTVTAGDHIDYSPLFKDDSRVAYTYEASVDNSAARREWVDIETTGLGEHNGILYYVRHDYVEVELPFEFPFYDKKYSRMYIYNTGFISFTKRNDDNLWPEPPAEFPAGSVYTNLIAPYWGMHSMDESTTSGTYHYLADDYAVVSFTEYGNSMNTGVDFQVILRRDGSFTFNYKAAHQYAIIYNMFGVAGISNIDGSAGISLPTRTVAFNNSVNFTPVVTNTLAAGESVDVDLAVKGDVMAGSYTSSIKVDTDIPTAPSYEIPVKLTILGTAEPHFPGDILVEHPVGYRNLDFTDWWTIQGALYYQEFEISNTGSAAFTIDRIDFRGYGVTGGWDSLFYLYYYGEGEDWFGNITEGWYQYSPAMAGKIEVGEKPLRLCVPMLPQGPYQTPGRYTMTLTYTVSGLEGVTKLSHKFEYLVTEAPELQFEEPEIRVVNALDNTTVDRKITFSNTGKYRLDYDYRLDISGIGEEIPDLGDDDWGIDDDWDLMAAKANVEGIATAAIPAVDSDRLAEARFAAKELKPFNTGASDNYFDVPSGGGYNNYLYWPSREPQEAKAYTWGTGEKSSEFVIATQYFGPEEGFNISGIYILLAPYLLDNKVVKAEIVNGDVTVSDDILGYGEYTIPASDQYFDNYLAFAVVRLQRPVYISPGQEFYVKITYPAGSPRVSAIVSKADFPVEGRYLAYMPNVGWADAGVGFNDSYGSMGYVTTCLETTPGQAWVKLLTPETSGSLEPGESASIDLRLSGASAPKDYDNKAVVVFHTNDPNNSIVNYPIYLDRNAAPAITASTTRLSVNEGDTEEVEFLVSDADGDDFAIRLDDNHPHTIATIKSVELADPTEEGVTLNEFDKDNRFWEVLGSKAGIRVVAQVAPKHGDAGEYSFTLTARDAERKDATVTVDYVVNHVNRAPVAIKQEGIVITVGSVSQPIDLNTLFEDPDGDALTFEVKMTALMSDKEFARIFRSDDLVVLYGLEVGMAALQVKATDEAGLSATCNVPVTISDYDGIEEVNVDVDVTVRPNPVTETLYVTIGSDSPAARLALYSLDGRMMLSETADLAAGEPHAIAVGHLTPGVYILRLTSAAATRAAVIIKN